MIIGHQELIVEQENFSKNKDQFRKITLTQSVEVLVLHPDLSI